MVAQRQLATGIRQALRDLLHLRSPIARLRQEGLGAREVLIQPGIQLTGRAVRRDGSAGGVYQGCRQHDRQGDEREQSWRPQPTAAQMHSHDYCRDRRPSPEQRPPGDK